MFIQSNCNYVISTICGIGLRPPLKQRSIIMLICDKCGAVYDKITDAICTDDGIKCKYCNTELDIPPRSEAEGNDNLLNWMLENTK